MNATILDNSVHAVSTNGVKFLSRIFDYPEGQSGTTRVSVNLIPKSFLNGLADCDAGRVVDMERAIEEPPPEAT
jgi:hypothetical protein